MLYTSSHPLIPTLTPSTAAVSSSVPVIGWCTPCPCGVPLASCPRASCPRCCTACSESDEYSHKCSPESQGIHACGATLDEWRIMTFPFVPGHTVLRHTSQGFSKSPRGSSIIAYSDGQVSNTRSNKPTTLCPSPSPEFLPK